MARQYTIRISTYILCRCIWDAARTQPTWLGICYNWIVNRQVTRVCRGVVTALVSMGQACPSTAVDYLWAHLTVRTTRCLCWKQSQRTRKFTLDGIMVSVNGILLFDAFFLWLSLSLRGVFLWRNREICFY